MKRALVTTSIVVTFIGLFITASPYLLKLFGMDDTFKNYILSEVIDDSRGKIDVHNFQIGFGKLTLRNVSLQPADQNFKLSMNAIEFAFNFWEVFSRPGRPEHSIEAIYLKEPSLFLSSSNDSLAGNAIPAEEIRKVFDNISKLSAVENIQITDGKIIWVRDDKEVITLVDGLNGNLTTQNPDDVSLEARGKILSSNKDVFFISSHMDFNNDYIDATILIDDYEVNHDLESVLPEKLKLLSGKLRGTLTFNTKKFRTDSTHIDGNLKIENFSAIFDEHLLHDTECSVLINNNMVNSEYGKAGLNASPVDFSIKIPDVFKPQAELTANIANLKLVNFKKYTSTSIFDEASVNANLAFRWIDSTSDARIELLSERLKINGNELIEQFTATISLNPQLLLLDEMSGIINNFSFTGTGEYSFQDHLLDIQLFSNHVFKNHVILDRVSDKELDFNLALQIDTRDGSADGFWDYLIAGESDTVIAASGNIEGNKGTLTVSVAASNSDEFQARAEILNYLDKPEISAIHLVNFPFKNLTTNKIFRIPMERFQSDIKLSGNLGILNGKIDLTDKKNYKNHFSLNTQIKNLFTPKRELSGTVKLKNLIGNYSFSQTSDYLEGRFDFPESISGDLVINLKNQDQILSRIEFNHLKIFDIISDTTLANRVESLAEINGKVHISGSTANPNVEAELYADKVVINEIGYFQGEFHLLTQGGNIISDSLVFYLNNLPILNGSVNYYAREQAISGRLRGSEIDLEPIIASVLPDNRFLSGNGSYDLNISGNIQQPLLSGNLNISDGIIGGFQFDQLMVSLVDSLKEGGSIFKINDHILKFSDLKYLRTGKINLTASGSIPLNATDPMFVRGEFVGDILHLVPKLSPFFRDATSISEVVFELGGSPGRVRFKSGYIDIERGELWLDKVAPYIRDISGRIEMTSGTNQVNFKNFVASVGDEQLTINTVRNISVSGGELLENWYFKGWDLDFGILQLETTDQGIPVNIPGLMEENEIAQMRLTGMKDEPYFYFAGPTKHPRARGTVTLYNTRFSYPFNVSSSPPGSKPSVVVEFLQNLHWDIIAHSGEDVIYYKDIPAYFDKVYTEVYIDEASPGIHFNGIINDGTFQPIGQAFSSRGRLEYLDQNFRVERFAVEFTQNDIFPYVSGRAWTTIRDSVGAIPKTIYLQLYAIDPETKEEKQQGSWDDFKFKLVSQDPQIGETQEQVLSYLGFSVGNIREKATSVGGAVTERYLIRPLLRPIERVLEKSLGVDLVRINSNIAKNLFYSSVGTDYRNRPLINPFATNTPYLFLMQSSELTVGKYLSQNIYLTYTGQLVSIYDQAENSFDLNHSFGLEYRFLRNVLLEFEYDRELLGYYRIPNQKEYLEDFKIRLRHSFAF